MDTCQPSSRAHRSIIAIARERSERTRTEHTGQPQTLAHVSTPDQLELRRSSAPARSHASLTVNVASVATRVRPHRACRGRSLRRRHHSRRRYSSRRLRTRSDSGGVHSLPLVALRAMAPCEQKPCSSACSKVVCEDPRARRGALALRAPCVSNAGASSPAGIAVSSGTPLLRLPASVFSMSRTFFGSKRSPPRWSAGGAFDVRGWSMAYVWGSLEDRERRSEPTSRTGFRGAGVARAVPPRGAEGPSWASEGPSCSGAWSGLCGLSPTGLWAGGMRGGRLSGHHS